MAIYHLQAPEINFFPISVPYKAGGRTLSEQNLLNIFRSYMDKDSFVISPTFNNETSFEFVIHGYYCAIDPLISNTLGPLKNETTPNIYAFISLERSPEESDPYYIVNCHDTQSNGIFEAIHFVASTDFDTARNEVIQRFSLSPEVVNNYLFGLHILTYDKANETFIIPQESLIKLCNHSLLIDEIDGGEI
jgi:hypothetical protein